MIKYLMAAILAVGTQGLVAEKIVTPDIEIEGVIYTAEELSQFSIILGYIAAVSLKNPDILIGVKPEGGPLSDQTGKTVLVGYDYFIENREKIKLEASKFNFEYPEAVAGHEWDYVLGFGMGYQMDTRLDTRPEEFQVIPFYEDLFRKSMEEALEGVPMPPITIKYKTMFDEMELENPDIQMDVEYIEKGDTE